jgi:SAM-dependent methyltransferase
MSADFVNQQEPPVEGAEKWRAQYSREPVAGPYPTEWVIRTIAGANYPSLQLDKSKYAGARILDLSCGDGRNLPLLLSLGFEVHATEISALLVDELRQRALARNWEVSFAVGQNTALPYPERHFDYVLACASLYYLDSGRTWNDVMKEVARIMKADGILIANFPDTNNFVLAGADTLSDGTMRIRNDPFKLRDGIRFMVPRDQSDVGRLIQPWFEPVGVGSQRDDFYGLMVSSYIFAARRNAVEVTSE